MMKGVVCKLDIEKAFDSLNWQFLMKVMQSMGFGNKWMSWIWWCISIAKFSVLVNGGPGWFFSKHLGFETGRSPLSLFVRLGNGGLEYFASEGYGR